MNELGEQLSQLWSDELPPAEAHALRARIATEPLVAKKWAQLCAAMETLNGLPKELSPPPLRAPAPVRSLPSTWFAVGLLAAAALLLVLLPVDRPQIVLARGSQWAKGEVQLLAGDAVVDVDGKVWVTVEPADPLARVGVPKAEDSMNKSTLIASLAGAIVTVVVYEGTAVVWADEGGEGVLVQAGQTHQTTPQHQPSVAAPTTPRTPQDRAQHLVRLQKELEAAQQALAEAQFEGALTRGQLKALQGTPSAWPADVPAQVGPDRFRAELEAKLAEMPDVAVAEVDCTEYPCVAAVQYTGEDPGDDWHKPMNGAVRSWLEGAMPEDMSISVNTSRFTNNDEERRYIIFGAHQAGRDSEVGTRTEFRIDDMVDHLGEQLRNAKE